MDADVSLGGVYRKMHIPDDPLFNAKFCLTPGDLGWKTVDTRYGKMGTLVCWDQWYPEAARLTALEGALALFYPTAIGWHPKEKKEHGAGQRDAWQTIMRSHAIANGVYVAAVNRIGHEGPKGGGIEFWGHSFICDPFGKVLAQASGDREEVLLAEVDPARQETVRQHWPFLRDRRVDAYGPILRRHRPHPRRSPGPFKIEGGLDGGDAGDDPLRRSGGIPRRGQDPDDHSSGPVTISTCRCDADASRIRARSRSSRRASPDLGRPSRRLRIPPCRCVATAGLHDDVSRRWSTRSGRLVNGGFDANEY
jgi:hypothetical protein